MKSKRIFIGIIAIYLLLHTTPTIALRTHVFISGYPVIAVTTKIVDDKFHNKVDKEILEKQNAKCYTLKKPPIEKVTQSELRSYKVTKIGPLYFAKYYGEA